MSFAVFATGGKQYLVAKGDKIQVEKLEGQAGDKVTFDQVLATISEKDAELGKPVLTGKSVEAKIVKQGRGKKIEVLKYKPKSKYRRKIGHRQAYTEIEITKI
ncbi:MAG TPA: 50S ribosomal protein L21 [Candidatus Doudnabacteria bacterium]|nr:50S ribosomal protein L21 [Candidatus Doudnabacteria bacterium]